MSKTKEFFKKPAVKATVICLTAVILITSIVCASVFGARAVARKKRIDNLQHVTTTASAKNVILMIGDGMGPNHLEVTKAWYDLDSLNMETMATSRGRATTFSRNADVTDSAAAATALSTGIKVNNGQVAYYNGQNIENMSEYADKCGKVSGIIATETLTGATPAGFSGHSNSRNNTNEIAASQLNGKVSLFMGAGANYYNDMASDVAEAGFTYVTDTAALTPDLYDDNKVFAGFDSVAPYGSTSGGNVGNLVDMSMFAVNFLAAKSGNGFFLMIEGSYIDKKSHSNDLAAMVKELRAFDEAVKAVVNWANADGDTAVIVTADHETGGLQYNGETGDALTDDLYTSGGHTATDVFWFAYGKTAPELTADRVIDNTDISLICRSFIKNDCLIRNPAKITNPAISGVYFCTSTHRSTSTQAI